MEIESKLRALGYALPTPSEPAGNYISCVQVGDLLFVGGNVGRFNKGGSSSKSEGDTGSKPGPGG